MPDESIAADLIDAVSDVLGDLGGVRTFRIVTRSALDIDNPGAAPTVTNEDLTIDAVLFDFDEKYMSKANVVEGDMMAIISIENFTDLQKSKVEPGNFLIDGTKIYSIVLVKPIEAAGIDVTYILQLKGH